MTSEPGPAVRFERAIPILRVSDLAASIDHYVRVLGFHVDFEGPGKFAGLSRDQCAVYLSEGDQGHAGSWVWIGVSDADVLMAELQGRGAAIRHPPTNYPWAYELQVSDPDGNVLRIGSEPKRDRPTTLVPWRDMDGTLWVQNPSGGFMRAT